MQTILMDLVIPMIKRNYVEIKHAEKVCRKGHLTLCTPKEEYIFNFVQTKR